MGKKLPPQRTPRKFVYAAIRKIWLYSRERQYTIKAENSTCEECGEKGNVHVHHRDGTSLKKIVDMIYDVLLVNPDKLEVLCIDCHKDKHKKGGK